jgi:hypothetical protein
MKYYYGDIEDDLYNSTRFLTSLSNTMIDCTYMTNDTFTFLKDYWSTFGNNRDNYTASLIQHLLGKLMTVSFIYDAILTDKITKNWTDLAL